MLATRKLRSISIFDKVDFRIGKIVTKMDNSNEKARHSQRRHNCVLTRPVRTEA